MGLLMCPQKKIRAKGTIIQLTSIDATSMLEAIPLLHESRSLSN
jgi:hypothetical protein